MGEAVRQYKALVRKNWINWKRAPKSALFEIVCSSAIFLMLVYIRTLVDITEFEASDLAAARHAVLPSFEYKDGEWKQIGV